MFDERRRGLPIWAWGAVVGLLLIAISSRSHLLTPENPALSQYFAAQPTPQGGLPSVNLPQLEIGTLPAELQATARQVLAAIAGGSATRPVEPTASSPRLRVTVSELQPSDGNLKIVGTVTNISNADLVVPISAFELRDSVGGSYVAGGGGSATLQPGGSTPLELTVPLPPGRGLLLVTSLPPDPILEQRLVVAEQGS